MDFSNTLRKLRRSIASLAVVAIVASLSVASSVSAFSDVPAGSWYEEFVERLVDDGIVDGSKDKFNPGMKLNRAEAAKIIVLAAGTDSADLVSPATPSFKDVAKGAWYYPYVETAKENGWVSGDDGKGTFRPGDNVSRAEFAKMITAALDLTFETEDETFSDVKAGTWYHPYVEAAYHWMVVDGVNGAFKPTDAIERSAMVKMTSKALDGEEREEGTTPPSPTDPTTPPAATGSASVSVAGTPAGTVLASGTAFNKVLKVTVSAGSDADVSVTSLTVTRGGISSNANVTGVGIFDSSDVRHGNIVSSWSDTNTATVDFTSEPIVVKKGTTSDIWVKANLNTGAMSGTLTFSVAKAEGMKSTAKTLSGSFPLVSGSFTLADGSSTVGTATVDAIQVHNNGTDGNTAVSVNLGTEQQHIATFRLATNNTEATKLSKVTLYNNGSAADADIKNISLLAPDGSVLAKVEKTTSKYVTFDLSASPFPLPKSSSAKDFKVKADIAGGSTRTVRFLLQNDYDLVITGDSSSANVLPTLVGGGTPSGNDQAFPVGDRSGANHVNMVTIAAGTLSFSKASTSPTGNVAAGGTNVVLGRWEVKPVGEDMEVRQISYYVARSASTDLAGTFKVAIKDGSTLFSQAGSAVDYTAGASTQTTTFVTLKAGQTYIMEAIADISTSASNVTYTVTNMNITSVKRLSTNDIVDPGTSAASANTLTAKSGSLTVTGNSGAIAPSVVAGQSSVTTLGTWDFTAGSGEAVSLTSVTIDDSTAGLGRNFKDLELWVDGAKRSQDTSSTQNPTATTTTVTFNLSPNYSIPSAQTSVVEVKGKLITTPLDVGSTVTLAIDASGVSGTLSTSQQSLSSLPTADVSGQVVTINTAGTLALSRDTVTNVKSSQLVAGTTGVVFGAYKLQTGNIEDVRIKKITVRNVGTNTNGLANLGVYSGATLVNDDAATTGNEGIVKASLGADSAVLGNDTKSVTFDYSGNPFVIAKNSSVVLSVKANTVYAATSGQTAQFVIDSIEAEGAGSNARIYVTLPGAETVAGGVSTQAYAIGDVISIHDASGVTADQDNTYVVATALASGGTITGGGALVDTFNIANTDVVSKWNKISTETLTAGTLATHNYAVGDVLVINDADDNSNMIRVVTTAVAAGASVAGAVDGVTLATGDILSRVASGASDTIDSSSAVRFTAGDVVVVNDTGDTDDGVYVVNADVALGTDITAAGALVLGYTFASGTVAKLPVISTELASTTSTYAYRAGDVVALHDASATTDDGIAVVKTAIAVGATNVGIGGFTVVVAESDRISKIDIMTASDSVKRLYPTKLNFAWTATSSSSLSTGNQIEVARFTIGADAANANNPGASVAVTALNFTELSSATLTNFTLNDVTNNANVATNASLSSFGSAAINGTMSTQTFQQGETRTYKMLADVGTNAGSQTAQFRFNAGSATTAGTATWSVTNNAVTANSTWTVLASDSADSTSTGLAAAATGSDVAAPTVVIDATGGTANNSVIDETFTVTFSERPDPVTINASLYFGGSVATVAATATGGIVSPITGALDVTITGIAQLTGNTASDATATNGTVTLALAAYSACSTTCVLTITPTGYTAWHATAGTGDGGVQTVAATSYVVRDISGNLVTATGSTVAADDY